MNANAFEPDEVTEVGPCEAVPLPVVDEWCAPTKVETVSTAEVIAYWRERWAAREVMR